MARSNAEGRALMDITYPILISHPHHRGIARRVAYACQAEHIPFKMLTGSLFMPGAMLFDLVQKLPPSLAGTVQSKVAKRRLIDLNAENVVSVCGLIPDLTARLYGGFRPGNFAHDWLVRRWMRRHVPDRSRGFFHGFSTVALHSLRAARKKGLITLLEIMSLPNTAEIYAREHQRLGKPYKMDSWPGILTELREADYLIAQSPVIPRYLQQFGVAADRIIVRPLGVDTTLFRPAEHLGRSRPFRAIGVGRLTIGKGLHHLLQAWSELGLPDAELVLAGPRVERESAAILAPFAGKYRYLEELTAPDLAEAYRASDIFVFPSLAEGGPLVVYEALASGLPCIVTDVAQAVARDGIEAFVFSPGDLDVLKNRIELLYRDAELRRKMALAARRRAEEYSWYHYNRRSGDLYRELLK
jgi:glycosyltransferase involved in cell wall biosynthesis